MKRTVLIFALALIASACSFDISLNFGGGPTQAAIGFWNLSSATMDGEDLEIVDGHGITISFDGVRIVGRGGCNTYSGEYRLAPAGHFEIRDGLAVTEMWCGNEKVMDTEMSYLDALTMVDRLQVDSNHLVLTGDGVELRYVLDEEAGTPPPASGNPDEPVTNEPGGMSEPGSGATGDKGSGGRWMLVDGALDGAKITILDGRAPRLVITDDSVGGDGICNSYFVSTPFPGDRSGNDVGTTRMSCGDEVDRAEGQYLQALQTIETLDIINGQLVLRSTRGYLIFDPA